MRFYTIAAFIFCLHTLTLQPANAQQNRIDSLFSHGDTTAVMDSLMADFENFLDSLAKPKSFFTVSLGIGTGFFSFEDKSSVYLTTEKKLLFSPSLSYYHKTGFGISATAFGLRDNNRFNFYQFAFSPSYDLIKRSFSTGISFTKYISKDSLDFYTTPIQNEIFTYFTYKKWWIRPSVSISYGWGTKTEYEQRKYQRLSRLLAQRNSGYYVTVENKESIRDFSLTFSLRKNFDWYNVLGKDDNITFTPVLLLNSGTQQFGFNTSYSYNATAIRVNSLPSNSNISDQSSFALQSVSMVMRGSYMKGRLLLQPQILFDYYLPESDSPFNTVFSVSAGISF